jgi:dienelactone hydrolase
LDTGIEVLRPVVSVALALALSACGSDTGAPAETPATGGSASSQHTGGSSGSANTSSAGAGASNSSGSGGATSVAGTSNSGGSGGSGTPDPGAELWQQKRATLLGVIARPQVPLDAMETPLPDDSGFAVHDFSYASDAKTRITGTSVAPKTGGPFPAVIFLHGTGGARQDGFGLLRTLAGKGFFALAIDARYHGASQGSVSYEDAIYQAYLDGIEHPFLYDTVWDVMRLLDHLEARPDIDAQRIGLVGMSKGGMETYLTAGVEPRIAVAVPWISVESFAWALDNDQWQARVESIQGAFDQAAMHDGVEIDAPFVRKFYDRVVPGIYADLDGPAMLPAIAPRPLLAVNGDMDPRTPKGGLDLCDAAAETAYAAVPDRFQQYMELNTGHAVTAEATSMTVDWFVKWLAP